MSTESRYVLPVGEMGWAVQAPLHTAFTWEYDKARSDLLALYEKGKRQQWNATDRIDWKQDLDPENPMMLPDETISLYGTDLWNRLSPKRIAELRRYLQALNISQFMQGEQGALICAAKIVHAGAGHRLQILRRDAGRSTRRATSRPTRACCTRSSTSPIR